VRVTWAVLCRYVEVHDGLGTIVGAGVDRIGVPELPAQVVATMAVRISGTSEEFAEFEVSAAVSGPNLDVVFDETFPPVLMPLTSTDPRIDVAWTLPIAFAFEVVDAGVHTIDLTIGGASARQSILVHIPEAPEQQL
jgi:hypothetical protein